MSAFSDLFKRKVGGTVVGNMLRGVVSNFSGGLLGNGLFMLKDGQTVDQNNQSAQHSITNGIIASNITNQSNNTMDNIKNFVKNNKVVTYITAMVVAFLVYTKFVKRGGNKW